jgi:hypothetical protein
MGNGGHGIGFEAYCLEAGLVKFETEYRQSQR